MKFKLPEPGVRDRFYLKAFAFVGMPLAGIALTMLCGFWWALDERDLSGATIILVGLTAFTFNNVHNEGFAYFKDKIVLYAYLPVWIINVIAYTYGYLVYT